MSTKRNAVARALMEGYSEDYERYRFALLSADMALEAADEWERRQNNCGCYTICEHRDACSMNGAA